MALTLSQSRDQIAALVKHFAANRANYLAPQYNEAQARQEFIDPLFICLGWDIRNENRVAPQYREVIVEESLVVEGHRKSPDYVFCVGQTPKFYVEAKKPGVAIKTEPGPAYQLRRYAWNRKLPLSLLTDFEELAVYDCRTRPSKNDKASAQRIKLYTYDQYPDLWPEIWDIFSREAVWAGRFDQFVQAGKGRRETSEVDTEFLKEIESWRDQLAPHIALRNASISTDDLNRAVQVTIDRIIFLRMAEDRGLESPEQLLKLCERPDIYPRFIDLCHKADKKYNSGLFHFKKESEVDEEPDRLTPALAIDDKALKPILQGLYFEHGSPYEFRIMPVEILGTVYERFLGKVIRITEGHRAKVEEKPEVRKAGGVYYTPDYIVAYIVKNTVAKLIEGRSPAQLAGKGKGQGVFRVLDMACGSGPFLLGSFQCLLDHALKWYTENGPERHKEAVYKDRKTGEWRLTIAEKKRILTTHIFGVDIDPQAVEVTKLSLLLKVLEGEDAETVGQTRMLWNERALPNLADNIKCGNSLIGPDYFTGKLGPDAEELKRVNPFDWNKEFPAAMADGGFDCIIGNPPYIRIQTMKEWAPLEVEMYKELYQSAKQGNYDIYVVFVERGLSLLNQTGRLGFILPHKFFNAQYGEGLRRIIAEGKHLAHVVHFGDQQVFEGATTYTCLLFLSQTARDACRFARVCDLGTWRGAGKADERLVPAAVISEGEWNFTVGPGASLFEKLSKMPDKLHDVAARIFQGLVTGCDPVFILTKGSKGRYFSEATEREHKLEKELMHRLCKGSVDIRRYHVGELTKSILFPYQLAGGKAQLLSPKDLAKYYPQAWQYLTENRDRLEAREGGKWRHAQWYAFGRSQNLSEMEQKKILTPSIAKQAAFTFDSSDFFYFVGSGGGGGGGYGITLKEGMPISYEYLLGLLNSNLLDRYLKASSTPFSGGYYAYNRQYIENLPIRVLNLEDSADKSRHDRMVALVENMLTLHKQLAGAKSEAQKTVLQRQIESTDAEIDRLVYDLYGLTKEEMAIVEGKT